VKMKILMVLTSHDRLGNTGRKTGFWLEELAAPYFVFSEAGVDITLASPKGGQPPLDPKSNEPEFKTEDTRRFEQDAVAKTALANTVKLSEVDQSDYDSVFFPGGHGPLWDLTNDPDALSLLEGMFAAKKPMGLVCHAPGILKNVKAPKGEPIVKGRSVTGFTNAEEAAMHLVEVVPYLVEDALRVQGANFLAATNFGVHVIQDGLLITGQNPASSRATAHALVDAFGREGKAGYESLKVHPSINILNLDRRAGRCSCGSSAASSQAHCRRVLSPLASFRSFATYAVIGPRNGAVGAGAHLRRMFAPTWASDPIPILYDELGIDSRTDRH
jgi:putative intracellular protease/amidase